MTFRLFSTGDASVLFGDRAIIRAEEAQTLRDASELLEQAAAILADAQTAQDTAVSNGLRTGREAAIAERQAFVAETLAPFIDEVAAQRDRLREDIATLALKAVKHILGALPAEITLTALADKALERLPVETVERIVVAPALAQELAARLPQHLAGRVTGDDRLRPDDCVIESRSGKVIASLDLQLERLAERWQVSSGEAA